MRVVFLFSFLVVLTGCAKVTNLTPTKTPETEQTGDPIKDEQNEMKILLPWELFV